MELKKIEYFTELYSKDGILDRAILYFADGTSEEQEFISVAKNNEERYKNIVEFIALWNEGVEETEN